MKTPHQVKQKSSKRRTNYENMISQILCGNNFFMLQVVKAKALRNETCSKMFY